MRRLGFPWSMKLLASAGRLYTPQMLANTTSVIPFHSSLWASAAGGTARYAKRLVSFVHAAARGGTCAFTRAFTFKIVSTLIKNSSRDDTRTFDLEIESTHGQPASCRQGQWMYMTASKISGGSVVYGARGCPRRPTLFSQTWKKVCFKPSDWDRDFLSSVFYTSAPKCVCIWRLASARDVSPAVLWTLRPEGGSESLTRAPRSYFMTQSLVLSIDVRRGLGISPRRIYHLAEFFSGQSWPNIWPRNMFFVFFFKFGT